MSLLLQTIEEYLADKHPEWSIGSNLSNTICIGRYCVQSDIFIMVDTQTCRIYTYPDVEGDYVVYSYYTEATLLPLLTKTISGIPSITSPTNNGV